MDEACKNHWPEDTHEAFLRQLGFSSFQVVTKLAAFRSIGPKGGKSWLADTGNFYLRGNSNEERRTRFRAVESAIR